MRRQPGQHRDPLAGDVVAIARGERPPSGPIAVLPEREPMFADAVTAGGGQVAELSDATRGIVWLSDKRADELVAILESHPHVGWVQLPWAGVDKFAGVLARYAGKPVPLWTSAKGSYSEPVAEHALALTLAVLRQLPQKSRATSWASTKEGLSLFGMNVVIIGAGGVAREIMRLLAPFEVSITVVRRSRDAVAGADRTVPASELGSVLPDADVVIVAAAATSETSRLIGPEQFAAMKPSAALINIARGALVDSVALAEALASGRLYGAGLDVTDPEPLPDGDPLWTEPRCIITSHTADTPEMTGPLLAERIRVNVEALVSGSGRFVGVVDPGSGY
jgi:phosphoglycerate dehydrogenase-like enzyme